jgi:hypothetical protein
MALNIYDRNGTVALSASPADSATHQYAIQEDNVLNLSFVTPEYVLLDVNDYVDWNGARYWIIEQYAPQQVSTVEFSYNCKFYGIESLIKRGLALKTVDGELQAAFTLTAPAHQHMILIVENINRVMGTTIFQVGEVIATENLVIDYNSTYLHDALSKIAQAAGTEWWFDGQTVNLVRCEHGTEITLAYKSGLTKLERTTANNVKFFTRLYPLGSTRNIACSKYGANRLHLPGGEKYVEKNTETYGIIEHSEETAFSHIYPRRVGVISAVRSAEKTGQDGNLFRIYYVKDKDLPFDPNNYEIPGLVKHIVFESGELNGRDFEVNYNSNTQEFEIVTQFPEYSDQLPNDILIPEVGNKYVLWNIEMPDEYITLAEQELKEAVDAYMADNTLDKSVYKATTDYIDIAGRGIRLDIGQRVRLESDKFFPAAGYRNSRITRITRNVNCITQADIEISDVLSVSKVTALENSVQEIKTVIENTRDGLPDIVKSWEKTRLTDSNILSALRVLVEIAGRAISKEHDDTAEGIITFMRGLVSNDVVKAKLGATFGDFVNSMIAGRGAGIDASGNAQVESLEVRSYMKVMELIINRVSAVESDYNFTESGTIDEVEEIDPGTYLLTIRKRWAFDFTAFAEHDVVYGSVNTLHSNGDYFTSWFRVLGVDTSANTLTVATYPDDEVPAGRNFAPVAGMNISRRGNAVAETRQSCWYISSFEGCIMYLEGVTKPILEESNYYLSLGRPKRLELFNGLPVNYAHPYLFARGAIIQDLLRIDFRGNPVYEILDTGLWSDNESYIRGYSETYGKYIQHQVWYKSSCWRCVTNTATVGLPPRWNNTEWVCVVGDSNFTLKITSSAGRFLRVGREYTTLGFVLTHGEMNITVDAWRVEWTRESDVPQEDLLWNIEHKDSALSVAITPSDLPSSWPATPRVSFRCTVMLLSGEEMQTFTDEFTINNNNA